MHIQAYASTAVQGSKDDGQNATCIPPQVSSLRPRSVLLLSKLQPGTRRLFKQSKEVKQQRFKNKVPLSLVLSNALVLGDRICQQQPSDEPISYCNVTVGWTLHGLSLVDWYISLFW